MKDRNGNEIKAGDILLNVENERSMHDSWAYWICLKETQGIVIRDFNAWNLTWLDTKDLVIIGNYRNFPEILKANDESIDSMDSYER